MEEQEVQEQQPAKAEGFLTKSTIIIIAVFAAVNIAVVLLVFGGRLFGGEDEGDAKEANKSPLENMSLINLGRIEASMPLGPSHQDFMHCSANVSLMVSAERHSDLSQRIKQFEAVFKELAREAFRNAKPEDLSNENLEEVKNNIRTGINEGLGEEGVERVIFGDYKPY